MRERVWQLEWSAQCLADQTSGRQGLIGGLAEAKRTAVASSAGGLSPSPPHTRALLTARWSGVEHRRSQRGPVANAGSMD